LELEAHVHEPALGPVGVLDHVAGRLPDREQHVHHVLGAGVDRRQPALGGGADVAQRRRHRRHRQLERFGRRRVEPPDGEQGDVVGRPIVADELDHHRRAHFLGRADGDGFAQPPESGVQRHAATLDEAVAVEADDGSGKQVHRCHPSAHRGCDA
jgi:hypothetical protein